MSARGAGRESLNRYLTVWRLEVEAGPFEGEGIDRLQALLRWTDTAARVAYLSDVLARIDFAEQCQEMMP